MCVFELLVGLLFERRIVDAVAGNGKSWKCRNDVLHSDHH